MTTILIDPAPLAEMDNPLEDENNFTSEQLANFGHFIKWARKQQGLTQEELARLMEVNISYIRALESGRRLGTTKTYYKLGKILQVRPGRFIDVLVGDAQVPDGESEAEEEVREIEATMNMLNRLKESLTQRAAPGDKKLKESMSKRVPAHTKLALDIKQSQKGVNKKVDK